jgi:uncharacterized protein (TIGR03067 family)
VTPAVFFLVLLPAAPAPKDGSKPAADNPLLGEWVVESHIASGKVLPKAGKVETITITKDRWQIEKESRSESFLSLDPAKDPPQIDVWVPDQEENRARGIYKIDCDTLTVCYSLGADRPTKFESAPKSGLYLMTLKRMKPAK